jgi:hypothetical protein
MLSSAASLLPLARTQIPRQRRRATLRNRNRNLFDLLLDETDPWETIPEEHQDLAIHILARLMVQVVLSSQERKNNNE